MFWQGREFFVEKYQKFWIFGFVSYLCGELIYLIMKIIENTTAYKCEFCGKTSLNRGCMTQHERACKKNPKNRSLCYNCAHLKSGEQEDITGYYDYFYGAYETVKTFDCHKCQCSGNKMFTPYHLNEFWRTTLEEEGWTPMPSELEGCPNFKAFEMKWSNTLGGIL